MKLVIDKDLVQKCGGGSSEYWFSYNDCTVKNISEIQDLDRPDDIGQTAYFVSLGLIPFISISNEEIMRAFVRFKGSKKLNDILQKVNSDNFIDTFWKYFNAYSSISEGFDEFENKFVIDKVKDWCEANSIEYTVAE